MKKLTIILTAFLFTGMFYSCEKEFDSIEPEVLDPIVEIVGTYDVEYWNSEYNYNTGIGGDQKMDDQVLEIISDGEGEYALYWDGDWYATLILEKNYDNNLYFTIIEHGSMWTSENWIHFEIKGGSWSKADYPNYPGSFQMNKNNKFEICIWYADLYYWESKIKLNIDYWVFFSGHRRTSETTVD